MTDASKKSRSWSSVRKHLASLDETALLPILKDLYELAPVNRDFLHARFPTEDTRGSALESYRNKVVEQFYPARGYGKLKLGEARKAIRDYRKATGDLRGTAELLMTFVENGTTFTRNFGDIDAPFYRSLESALDDLVLLIRRDAPDLYPVFADRFADVESKAYGIGWGFSDYLTAVIEALAEDFGNPE